MSQSLIIRRRFSAKNKDSQGFNIPLGKLSRVSFTSHTSLSIDLLVAFSSFTLVSRAARPPLTDKEGYRSNPTPWDRIAAPVPTSLLWVFSVSRMGS
jgi:hypothetical protein